MSAGTTAAPDTAPIAYDLEAHYRELEQKITAAGIAADLGRVRAAFECADRAHSGQKRKDGSPYVSHCIAAAIITAEMGLDEDSIVAALLHDCIEDTSLTHEDIAHSFGSTVADIVEGVTKLTRVQYTSVEEQQMENLRKMLLAMAKDIRVILIKMADRLHNMRTMAYQTEEKQRIKSLETMEIYAPIAHRLGMQKIKWELEDLSLLYLDPEGYKAITDTLNERMDTLERFMGDMQRKIQARLEEDGVQASIFCRIKHIYSIYRKMYAQKIDINGIFDLCAFRVIVETIPDCYNVLGIIHDMFKPVPGRFKDYISTPKPNMYQSVHTTVIGSEGIPFEVQIRTWDMHLTAEYGVAAHWKYKTGEQGAKPGDEEKFAWIRRLLETQQESDAQDFFHNLKVDMFADEVFVFSPKGDVINLPAGATPIDFAYSIHSEVGNGMVGAKVNGRIVNFDHVLQNGDIVDIRTSKNAPGPSRDWLNLAKSGAARTKIKQWFKKERREENIVHGKEQFERELRANGIAPADIMGDEILPLILKRLAFTSLDDLYAAIGYGGLTAVKAVGRIRDDINKALKIQANEKQTMLQQNPLKTDPDPAKHNRHAVNGVIVEDIDSCMIKFAKCCTPVPGDAIVGFITKGFGVSIHRADCPNAQNRDEPHQAARWVRVRWAAQEEQPFETTLELDCITRDGLLLDVATTMTTARVRVKELFGRDLPGGHSTFTVRFEVKNVAELESVRKKLMNIRDVVGSRRGQN